MKRGPDIKRLNVLAIPGADRPGGLVTPSRRTSSLGEGRLTFVKSDEEREHEREVNRDRYQIEREVNHALQFPELIVSSTTSAQEMRETIEEVEGELGDPGDW